MFDNTNNTSLNSTTPLEFLLIHGGLSGPGEFYIGFIKTKTSFKIINIISPFHVRVREM